MAQLELFQIDAFTKVPFHGNPAAVCPLEEWLDDGTLQAIAQENNLAETAFFVPREGDFHIRWFTPRHEVPLCGHATLASAFVIFTELDPERQSVRFESKSGPLQVIRQGSLLTMDFPAFRMRVCQSPPAALSQGLREKPEAVYSVDADSNYYAVYPREELVRCIDPDFSLLEQLHPYGVAVTAPGKGVDSVSRYFAPSHGIPEDPVTGSIHCALVPYWAERLKKSEIRAYQASARGGELICEDRGDRVHIGGHAVKYLAGTITL